jgi:hypothetical protein
VLAGAVLADPCYWSPELPACYQVELELSAGSEVVQTIRRTWGMRHLGCRGRSFYWANRRWVLRGMAGSVVPAVAVHHWRELSAVMVVECPDDELCRETTVGGVVLAAAMSSTDGAITAQLRRLAQWPSVALAILDVPARIAVEEGPQWRHAAPNLLLAARLNRDESDLPQWARLAVVDESHPAVEYVAAPLIVSRRRHPFASIDEARAACDGLQRDMAPRGDFAGYLIERGGHTP